MLKSTKWAFTTMGIAAVNTALMANGIETIPGMFTKDVYDNPGLGASIGAMTGLGIGGALAATGLIAKEAVTVGIDSLRDKFTSKPNNPKKLKI